MQPFYILTVLSALSVVSSREAATQPSSVDPPSHMPAKAAMLLYGLRGKKFKVFSHCLMHTSCNTQIVDIHLKPPISGPYNNVETSKRRHHEQFLCKAESAQHMEKLIQK